MENKQTEKTDIRAIVLQMLVDTIEKRAFSHIVLNQAFSSNKLNHQEKIFAGRLYHGVLERVFYLDWIISSYSSVKINKMKPVIRDILRSAVYQIRYMKSVPAAAAVNEAVYLTQQKGFYNLKGFSGHLVFLGPFC